MRLQFLFLSLVLISFFSCSKEPEGDVAEVGVTYSNEPGKEGIVYTLDTSSSIITWMGTQSSGRHNGIMHFKNGSFLVKEKEILPDNNRQSQPELKRNIGDADITIDMNSVDILDLKFDPDQYHRLLNRLHSKEVLSTGEFPNASFELLSITPLENDSVKTDENDFNVIKPTHTIIGNLTIKGITGKIEFPAKVEMRNQKLEVSAKFNLNRTDWNIHDLEVDDSSAQENNKTVSDTVTVGIEILAFSENH